MAKRAVISWRVLACNRAQRYRSQGRDALADAILDSLDPERERRTAMPQPCEVCITAAARRTRAGAFPHPNECVNAGRICSNMGNTK